MPIYPKTDWKDHIKDAGGAIIQQGTPLSAGNLNKLEKAIADNSVFLASELAAAAANSGVLDFTSTIASTVTGNTDGTVAAGRLGDINFIYLNPFNVLINGYKMLVNSFNNVSGNSNKIDLPAPPTTGEREDLIFLEAWRDEVTQDWKTRIRTVAGVDFNLYLMDGFTQDTSGGAAVQFNSNISPQGGNTAPITTAPPTLAISFKNYKQRGPSVAADNYLGSDVGLYVAGRGDTASKSLMKTYDGYVYAIPLFRVKRRNNGGYSVANPGGAREYFKYAVTGPGTAGETKQFTIDTTNGLKVGDTLVGQSIATTDYAKIISIDSATTVTIQVLTSWGVGTFQTKPDRPDGLFSNIIAERDITDLRHKVSLTGYDYDQVVTEAFEKLVSTELQTKDRKQMVKAYHGVRKTPIDANHVFYASLDGNVQPELGNAPTVNGGNPTAVPGFTGIAAKLASGMYLNYILALTGTAVTLDLSVDEEAFLANINSNARYMAFLTYGGMARLGVAANGNPKNVSLFVDGAPGTSIDISKYLRGKGLLHFRVTYNNGTAVLYVNGQEAARRTDKVIDLSLTTSLQISNVAGFGYIGSISDVSVSNIDRGATFATLPADFVSGHAKIMPAFNNQRQVQSDALTSQRTFSTAKVQNQTQEKGITVTKGAGVNTAAWEAGDKVKVAGRAGEVITGVIDTDTSLARVLASNSGNTVLTLDNTSGLSVNDTFIIRRADGTSWDNGVRTITAIDTTAKTITVNTGYAANVTGALVFETTASTSSPVVRANIVGTVTTVPGTWANLGTNEAEFTLGTPPAGLDVEDLLIEYSLNMPAGQGGTPEVYTDVLAGEFKGQKLVKGTLAMVDDFKDKVTGSTTVNPHKVMIAYSDTLLAPTAFGTEATQAQYDVLKSLDNNLLSLTTATPGQRVLVLKSYDVVALAEKKYGVDFFKGCLTLAEKVQRVKDRIGKIIGNSYLFGSGAGGNKSTYRYYSISGSSWTSPNSGDAINTTGSIVKSSLANNQSYTTTSIANLIDSNGLINFLSYSEPADASNPAVLNVDYGNIDVELATKTGYDLLVPENPRRDAGVSNAFYVRKETKEIEALVPTDENGGVVTHGDFVPYQGIFAGVTIDNLKVLTSPVRTGFATTYGTGKAKPGVTLVSMPVPLTSILPIGVNVNAHDFVNDNLLTSGTAGNSNELLKRGGLYLEEQHHASATSYVQLKTGAIARINNTPLAKRGSSSLTPANHSIINAVPNTLAKTLYGSFVLAVNANKELYLIVMTKPGTTMTVDAGLEAAVDVFRIPGRPLAPKGA